MEIEGYRLLQVTKAGVAIYEDATTISLDQKSARMRPRLVGVSAVKATLDEFTDTFGRDSDDGFTLLNPDMHSCQKLHQIAAERERYIDINWLAMQPTWTGSMARRRDFVVLACEETFYTGSQHNRRGWANMMHSVQLPWCPPLDKLSSIVRGSMHQTGVIVLESEASPEWLHVISIVEIDMKGNIADRSQRANALKRIGCLESIAPTIVKQRLQRMSLMRTKQFNAAKPTKESHCAVCTQRIGIPSLRLHHYCRKCSNSVCGTCSRNWQLDPNTKKKTRVCGLCIMATQKCTKSTDTSTTNNDNDIVYDGDDDDVLKRNIPLMQRAVTDHRPSRAQAFLET
uniref:FYVE-type domain-containing protein n=1 Tax=Globisporangium ultimum (strain ATCC 200006 / CBS 805.95 / DAOM BR144) TaxID=431595 RepID=K3W5N5_GLOUD